MSDRFDVIFGAAAPQACLAPPDETDGPPTSANFASRIAGATSSVGVQDVIDEARQDVLPDWGNYLAEQSWRDDGFATREFQQIAPKVDLTQAVTIGKPLAGHPQLLEQWMSVVGNELTGESKDTFELCGPVMRDLNSHEAVRALQSPKFAT